MATDSPTAPDVTQAQLDTCRRHASRIIEDIEEAAFLLDPDLRVVACNAGAVRLLRRDADTIVGHLLAPVLDPGKDGGGERVLADLAGSGRIRRVDAELVGPNGERVPVRVSGSRLDDEVVVGYHVILRDLRESHEIRRQLLRADRLATIGLLASSVAHEVGTPLNVILGRAEILEQALADNPSARRQLGAISSQIQRIADVVGRLLTFSRENGTGNESVELNRVLQEVLQFVEQRMRNNKVKLELSLVDTMPVLVGNPSHFHQVFLNLVMNAIDAMPDGGQLQIATSVCEGARFVEELECRCLQVRIRDTGVGIETQHLRRIFEPFYTTKGRSKGTGLGLAIADEIVRKYGGQLQVESTPGNGTQFVLNLPQGSRALQVVR